MPANYFIAMVRKIIGTMEELPIFLSVAAQFPILVCFLTSTIYFNNVAVNED